MRKFRNQFLAIIVLSLIVSSCTTFEFDIVKRRYRKGYYVSVGIQKHQNQNNIYLSENNCGNDTLHINNEYYNEPINNTISYKVIKSICTDSSTNEKVCKKSNSATSVDNPFPKIFLANTLLSSLIIKNNHKSLQSVKTFSKKSVIKEDPKPRNTGFFIKIIGIIIASIGVMIYISAFPASMAGMTLGRIFLVIGILTWCVGKFM